MEIDGRPLPGVRTLQFSPSRRGSGLHAKVAVYDSGDRIEATLRRHLPPGAPQVRLVGDSDHASFERADIPADGLFTGLDAWYHQACDTIANVDRRVLATSIRAGGRRGGPAGALTATPANVNCGWVGKRRTGALPLVRRGVVS